MDNAKKSSPIDGLRKKAEKIIGHRSENFFKEPSEKIAAIMTDVFSVYNELETQNNELQIARDKYSRLYNSAPSAYITIDIDGNIVEVNDTFCRLLDIEQKRLRIKRNMNRFVHKDDMNLFRRMCNSLHEENSARCELRMLTDDSRMIWCRLEAGRYEGSRGSRILYQIIINDISAEKKIQDDLVIAREEAEEAVRMQRYFAASMVHEIRNPLNVIYGFAELLSEQSLNLEQKQYVKVIKSRCEDLLALINDMLDLSRMNSGKIELKASPVHIPELMQSLEEMFQARASAQKLSLSFSTNGIDDGCYILDELRLRQILSNLITNALKFTQKGGVKISARRKTLKTASHDILYFSVEDSGAGIPADKLPEIFTPFYQVPDLENKLKIKREGAGLGLAICKRLVELMKGRIEARSKLGQGTVFEFSIPAEKSSACGIAPEKAAEAPADGKKMHVLLVDDDESNIFLMKKILSSAGHIIKTATNGKEAILEFKNDFFDIILMDIEMPCKNGLEASREIRLLEKRKKQKAAKIIALTGKTLQEEIDKCYEAGVDLHLCKPVRKNALLTAISDCVKRK